ncbi:MAG TPA: hypothetical protein VJ032_10380, partial [Thermoanaerobaculia bacterium]|nr:hypothetical protein [Thermoanaerobaculia bacterium]
MSFPFLVPQRFLHRLLVALRLRRFPIDRLPLRLLARLVAPFLRFRFDSRHRLFSLAHVHVANEDDAIREVAVAVAHR